MVLARVSDPVRRGCERLVATPGNLQRQQSRRIHLSVRSAIAVFQDPRIGQAACSPLTRERVVRPPALALKSIDGARSRKREPARFWGLGSASRQYSLLRHSYGVGQGAGSEEAHSF